MLINITENTDKVLEMNNILAIMGKLYLCFSRAQIKIERKSQIVPTPFVTTVVVISKLIDSKKYNSYSICKVGST